MFDQLNEIDVSDKIEKKNNLTYLSWAWAWRELKKVCPLATYKVYETPEGRIYWHDGQTAWVKTGVTTVTDEGHEQEYIEYLPVMDYKNKSIPLDLIQSTDVNKAIQRSITKCIARHGLGLYIYAGEDLPEERPKPGPPRYVGLIKTEIMRLTDNGEDADSLADIENMVGFPLKDLPNKTAKTLQEIYRMLRDK